MFAPTDDNALSAAIQYVGMDENLGVGVGRLQDFLVIRWTSPLEGLSPDIILGMIDGVAGHADRLEAYVSGGQDVFGVFDQYGRLRTQDSGGRIASHKFEQKRHLLMGIFSRQKYEEGTLRLWTGGSHSLPYAVKWRAGRQTGLDGQEWNELYRG